MQIRVDKLRKKIGLLQNVVPKNPTLKILNNILFSDGHMTATDLETSVSVSIADRSGEAFLLPFRNVMDLLKYVPGDLVLTIETKDKSIRLSWDGGSAAYLVPDCREYPTMELKAPTSEAVLNGDVLIGAMADALPYCATESARPVLTGVAVILDEVIQVCGADGFRTSYEALKLSYPVKQTIILPANTVTVLESLWDKEPGQPGPGSSLVAQLTAARPLRLALGDGYMNAKFANLTVVSKLIEGTFPDILALLNNFKEPVKVKVFAPDLYNAVRRLAGITKEGTHIVKLLWTDTRMTVSARANEVGEVQAEIVIQEGSNPGRIALNLNYLLDYLTGKDGLITLGGESRTRPAVFHYGTRPIVAIMPMLAQWEDEPQPTSPSETTTTEEPTETTAEDKTPDTESKVEPAAAAPEPAKKKSRKGGKQKKEKAQ